MSENPKTKYSQVVESEDADANVFTPESSIFGPRLQMGLLLFAGIMLMLTHHFLYSYVDGKPIGSLPFAMHGISILVSDQSVVSALGNAIAYVARVILSAAIGVVFIQVLWLKLRRRQYSVKEIDALVACKGQPFSPSALPTWHYAFVLAAIASVSSGMAFISIIAPGSLRVGSSEISSPCTVETVSLNTSNIALGSLTSDGNFTFTGTQTPLVKLAARVLIAGAPLPAHNPCNDSCRYQITFDAPLTNCTPVGSDFNFTAWLPPPVNSTSPITVWNTNEAFAGSQFVAASRNLANNSQTAVNCMSYKGTYTVQIVHGNGTTSAARVVRTVQHGLTYAATTGASVGTVDAQYDAITTAFVNVLKGSVKVDPTTGAGMYYTDTLLVGMSPAFAGSTKQTWSPTSDLGTEIMTFMQNISMSLLAGQLSDEGDSPTTPFNTTCFYPTSTFNYHPTQLFVVYGATLGITALCILIGVRSVRLNGVEESFSFSRIVGAVLNSSLFDGRFELTKSSRLTADGSTDGQLRLVHTDYGNDQVSDNVIDKLIL